MENYIVINGRKAELTAEQLKALGLVEPAKVLNNYTMQEVLQIIRSGHAREHFDVHDVIKIAGYELEIIGFDHDECAEGPTRPTVTVMHKKTVAQHRMHPSKCEKGWSESELRDWLNGEFFNSLPEEIRCIVSPTRRVTYDSAGRAHTTVDKLFIPSESELFGSAIYSPCMAGERYEAFATSKDRARTDKDGRNSWWTCSAASGGTTTFVLVSSYGSVANYSASNARGVPVCFQIS